MIVSARSTKIITTTTSHPTEENTHVQDTDMHTNTCKSIVHSSWRKQLHYISIMVANKYLQYTSTHFQLFGF